jgi:hypothetical protein
MLLGEDEVLSRIFDLRGFLGNARGPSPIIESGMKRQRCYTCGREIGFRGSDPDGIGT